MNRAGDRNRRVVIEQREVGTGPIGQPIDRWVTFRTCWANYKAPSGFGAATNVDPDSNGLGRDIVRCSWRMNYYTDISVDMRLNYKGEIYDIKAVLPDIDRRDHTDLVCTRGGSDG